MPASDLLLLHGTIYGNLPPVIAYKGFDDISATIGNAVAAQPESADFPWIEPPVTIFPGGTMTDNSPVDLISWTGAGDMCASGYLEWWQQCMTLFMRRI